VHHKVGSPACPDTAHSNCALLLEIGNKQVVPIILKQSISNDDNAVSIYLHLGLIACQREHFHFSISMSGAYNKQMRKMPVPMVA
jgi:hypothetical protein